MPIKITHTKKEETREESVEKTRWEKGWWTRLWNIIIALREQLAEALAKIKTLKKENRALKKKIRELQG